MSIFPCEDHGRRVPGALESLRLTVLDGEDRYSRRMRLCPEHLEERVAILAEAVPSLADGQYEDREVLCPSCQQPLDRAAASCAVFLYVNRRHAETDERYARFCLRCGSTLVHNWALQIQQLTD